MIKQILKNVKNLRELEGWSQEDVAEKLSVSQSAYARFENGKTKTDLELLVKFATLVNMPLIDVITYPVKYAPADGDEMDTVEAFVQIRIKGSSKVKLLKELVGDSINLK